MAKIPTYTSKRTITGNVRRPSMPDYSAETGRKVAKIFNKIADVKAEKDALKQGYEDVYNKNVNIKDVDMDSITIRGSAYSKGAKQAFVATTKTDVEEKLSNLYANTELNANVEAFNKEAEKIKNEYAGQMSSDLQMVMLPEIDKVISGYRQNVNVNQVRLADNENTQKVFDRLNNVLMPRIDTEITKGNLAEEDFAESLAILKDLLSRNKISPQDFAKNRDAIVNSIVVPYFKNKMATSDNPAKFLDGITDKSQSETVLKEVYEIYGDEYKNEIGDGFFPKNLSDDLHRTVVSTLETEFNKMGKRMASEQKVWELGFENTIKTSIAKGEVLSDNLDANDLIAQMTDLKYSNEQQEAFLNTWKAGAITTNYTKGHHSLSLNSLETKISEIDNELAKTEELDVTDPNTNIKKIALADAKEILTTRQTDLINAKNNGTIYAYLEKNPNETNDPIIDEVFQKNVLELTAEDLYKRRKIASIYLGLNNEEGLSLLDDNEIKSIKEAIQGSTSVQEIAGIVTMIDNMGLDAKIYRELELAPEFESLFILNPASDSFKFAAESYLNKEANKRNTGLTDAKVRDAVISTVTDLEIDDVDQENAMIDVLGSYYLQAYARVNDETRALEIAKNYFDRAFQTYEAFNGQNILIPSDLKQADFEKTMSYAEEMLKNPIKYGIQIDGGIGVNDIDIENNVLLVRDGDKLVFQIRNKSGTAFNTDGDLSYYTVQHPSDGANSTREVLAINIDPNKRVTADAQSNGHLLWSGFNVKGKAPSIADKEAYENYYFKLATDNGFAIDTVEPFVTNIEPTDSDKQVILTGIMLKYSQTGKLDKDDFNYLSQYEALEGLAIPEVQSKVLDTWQFYKDEGGFATIRTGEKLSPSATLYVITKDFYEDYLTEEIKKLENSKNRKDRRKLNTLRKELEEL